MVRKHGGDEVSQNVPGEATTRLATGELRSAEIQK
jgi:hypothetical protein